MSAGRAGRRIAWRELRRRPGRTALVVALIAVPVAALVIGTTAARTAVTPQEVAIASEHGGGDVTVAYFSFPGSTAPPIALADAPAKINELVPGARVAATTRAWGAIHPDAGPDAGAVPIGREVSLSVLGGAWDDPIVTPMAPVLEGRMPRADGEVALTPTLADELGVRVGDHLAVPELRLDATVVGLATVAGSAHRNDLFLARLPDLAPDTVSTSFHIELPPDASTAALVRLAHTAFGQSSAFPTVTPAVAARIWPADEPCTSRSINGWTCGGGAITASILGGLAGQAAVYMVLGIVISTAFTVGARRQLRTLGLVGASGGSPATTRTIVRWQGVWCGVVGAVAGIVLALVVLVAAWPWERTNLGFEASWWTLSLLDLLAAAGIAIGAATLSALLPAASAARVSVLHALAGRAPTRPARPRIAALGAAMFALGTLLLAAAVVVQVRPFLGPVFEDEQVRRTRIAAVLAVAGVVTILASSIPIAQFLVGAVGRLAGHVGTRAHGRAGQLASATRLALRGLARQRARFGSVAAAIAATSALAVALATWSANQAPTTDWYRALPAEAVVARGVTPTGTAATGEETRRAVLQILPGAREIGVATVNVSVPFQPLGWETEGAAAIEPPPGTALVATPEVLDALAVDGAGRAALARSGAVLLADPGAVAALDPATRPVPPGLRTPAGPPGTARAGTPGTRTFSLFDQGQPGEPIEAVVVARPTEGRSLVRDGVPTALSSLLVTPELLAAHRIIDVPPSATVFVATAPITDDQRTALQRLTSANPGFRFAGTPAPPQVGVEGPRSPAADYRTAVQLGAVGTALLLAGLVLVIGLALAAADNRDERAVLDAIGTPPKLQRRLSGIRAGAITLVAMAIALPTGIVPVLVVLGVPVDRNLGTLASGSLTARVGQVPWATVGLLLVAVPLVLGLATTAASGASRRLRPLGATRGFDD